MTEVSRRNGEHSTGRTAQRMGGTRVRPSHDRGRQKSRNSCRKPALATRNKERTNALLTANKTSPEEFGSTFRPARERAEGGWMGKHGVTPDELLAALARWAQPILHAENGTP